MVADYVSTFEIVPKHVCGGLSLSHLIPPLSQPQITPVRHFPQRPRAVRPRAMAEHNILDRRMRRLTPHKRTRKSTAPETVARDLFLAIAIPEPLVFVIRTNDFYYCEG